MKEILFVCSGNTCRSPLAEALARREAEKRGLDHLRFSSAGTSAFAGMPASDGVQEVARAVGLDLSEHRSRPLEEAMCREAQLILTMESAHQALIRSGCPEQETVIHTLYSYVRGIKRNVDDPYGGNRETYRRCVDEITGLIVELIEKLEEDSK